jgi:hypothetical protein
MKKKIFLVEKLHYNDFFLEKDLYFVDHITNDFLIYDPDFNVYFDATFTEVDMNRLWDDDNITFVGYL